MDPLKVYFLLKIGIFQPAMLVYQRVQQTVVWLFFWSITWEALGFGATFSKKKTGALKMGSSLNPEPNPLGSVRPLRSPLRFASVLENVLAQAGATNIAGWEIHHEWGGFVSPISTWWFFIAMLVYQSVCSMFLAGWCSVIWATDGHFPY